MVRGMKCIPRWRKSPLAEGAGNRARTDDLLITNQLLYQLSYAGIDFGNRAKKLRLTDSPPRFSFTRRPVGVQQATSEVPNWIDDFMAKFKAPSRRLP